LLPLVLDFGQLAGRPTGD